MANGEKRELSLGMTVVLHLVGYLVGILLAWGAMNARVAVVESQINGVKEQLQEIRSDVKQLLRKQP